MVSIPLEFVIMRASIKSKKDKHFDDFLKELAKENNLTRGAYHFIVQTKTLLQNNNFLESVNLESGDLHLF